ncbi:MAG: low molecular weight phosphotyrosine protein phosphatase [bacterium]|nr:low molecular weight phosphotyrosine protein phosphatase [bacterium]
MSADVTRVLFVCIGNICRSPTAEAVFRMQVEKSGWGKLFTVDSAGTSGFHVGEPPDRRAQKHAAERGYNLSALRARQIGPMDFDRFDLILVMEKSVLDTVQQLKNFGRGKAEVSMFLDYLPGYEGQNVPDPYYGNADGFSAVLDLVEEGSTALLRSLLKKQGVLGCSC